MKTLFVLCICAFFVTTSVSAGQKTSIHKTKYESEIEVYTGKNLPEFVKLAIEMVPTEYELTFDEVVVVPSLEAFLTAMSAERYEVAPLTVHEWDAPIYIVMDYTVNSKEDPFSWVPNLEKQWLRYRQTKETDPGMVAVLAVAIVHEVGHIRRMGEEQADSMMIPFIEQLVREGKLQPELATDYLNRIQRSIEFSRSSP